MEDKSEILYDPERISLFRSIAGPGIFLCQERYDVAFTVKELASRMANPTTMSFHHLKKFYGLLSNSRISTSRRRLCEERRHSQVQTGVEQKP